MANTKLYVVRHGKTRFNTIGRAQGWCDSPLTEVGEEGIHELGAGLKAEGVPFKRAFSSDSGRTILTMDILLEELDLIDQIPYQRDKRIREWCFGSLDGDYQDDLFIGILPRTEIFAGRNLNEVSYPEIAQGIYDVDTAGWAEPWEVLKGRLLEGFTDIAKTIEADGGGNALVVCHGMSIGTLVWLLDPERPKQHIENGSVTVLEFENGQLSVLSVGDLSYREKGREICREQEK